jgi:hypothetical protein
MVTNCLALLPVPGSTKEPRERPSNYRRLDLDDICEAMKILRCDAHEQIMRGNVYQDRYANHEHEDEGANDDRHFFAAQIGQEKDEHRHQEDSEGDGRRNEFS